MTALLFVSETPWLHDAAAAALFDELLAGIGLSRATVEAATVLEAPLPGDRDPRPEELDAGSERLFALVKATTPRVIAPLGGLPTLLMLGGAAGITAARGRPEPAIFALVGYWILPLFHPAWAVRTRSLVKVLRRDFALLPELLERPRPEPEQQPELDLPEHVQLAFLRDAPPTGVTA